MFDFQPRLAGDLVELRPLVASDWKELHAAASDPLIWAQHPQPNRHEEEVFRVYFEEGLASGGALVARDRASDAVIGSSRYSTKFVQPDEMEIGWTFLRRSHWGGAYNREMKLLMLGHAFGHVDTVILRIGDQNSRSRRAAEKIGGILIGGTESVLVGDLMSSYVRYAITRESLARSPAFKTK
jgi:N-acetyltransferase